ncbi:mug158 [Symbiodinium sp. CCMP2592]|nr:mug158 [Symbiodinium sp. CCMP2592]
MTAEPAPNDPNALAACKQEPHEGHLKIIATWNDITILEHQMTKETLLLRGEVTLKFNAAGFAFVRVAGESTWLSKLLKYHLFRRASSEGDTSEGSSETEPFVITRTETGTQSQWLKSFLLGRRLLQTDLSTALQTEKPVSILQARGPCRHFWRLTSFIRKPRQTIMGKLRRFWLPAFVSELQLESGRGHVLWPPHCKETGQGETEDTAHDLFVSTLFLCFLLHMLYVYSDETTTLLPLFLQRLLPEKWRVRVASEAASLVIRHGNVTLSELTERTCYKERMRGSKKTVPMKSRKTQPVHEVLKQLWRTKALRWLRADVLKGLSGAVDAGVLASDFGEDPCQDSIFDSSDKPDMRDPAVRMARVRAARVVRGPADAKLSARAKTNLKVQKVRARSMVKARQRVRERFQYWMSCRRVLGSAKTLHIAFDASRVGGKKRSYYAILDSHTGLAAWGPPLILRDSGYRAVTSEPTPEEQGRLDSKTRGYLLSLRARDNALSSEAAAPVVEKKQRLPSFEQVVALEQTLQSMCPSAASLLEFTAPDPEGRLEMPVLCFNADAGPDVMSCLQFLQNHVRVRMIHFWDPRHRLARELENAVSHAKLKGALSLGELVINFSRGPWSSHKWFRRLQEEMVDFAATLSAAPPDVRERGGFLFQHLREEIALQAGLHVEEVTPEKCKDLLQHSGFLRKRGPSNMSRWDAFAVGWSERKSELGLLKLLCLSYGLKAGYLQPATNAAANRATEEWAGQVLSEGDGDNTLGSDAKQRLFQKCVNKLHVVTNILLQKDTCDKLNCWFHLSWPISQELHRLRTTLKRGRDGCEQHLLEEARGSSLEVLTTIFETAVCPDVREDLAIWHGARLGAGMIGRMTVEDPIVKFQNKTCQMVLETALELAHVKMQYASVTMFSWPSQLVLLAFGTEEEQNVTLVNLYLSEQAHARAMANSEKLKWLRVFAKRSPMGSRLMRDVVANLHSSEWRITKRLLNWLQPLFRGLGATWNEEAFGDARELEGKENKGHELSSTEAWECCSYSRTLTSFGFREIQTEPTEAEGNIPESLFRLEKNKVPEKLKAITAPMKWTSLSQIGLCAVACELAVLKDAMDQDRVAQLSDSWRSGMLRRGTVVGHTSFPESDRYLSMGAWPSHSGALLLPLKTCQGGFNLDLPLTKDKLKFVQVFRLSDWFALPTTVKSPLHHAIRNGGTPTTAPLLTVTGEARKPILQYCAEHAFFDMDETRLSFILKEECGMGDLDFSNAETALGEMLSTAVQKTLSVSEDQAADIMERSLKYRQADDADLNEILQSPEFQELLTAETDKQIKEVLSESKTKHRKAMFESKQLYSEEHVNGWLPPQHTSRRDEFNKCWRAEDRNGVSTSRSWGDQGDGYALHRMLTAAWEKYLFLHPAETCPWDFTCPSSRSSLDRAAGAASTEQPPLNSSRISLPETME